MPLWIPIFFYLLQKAGNIKNFGYVKLDWLKHYSPFENGIIYIIILFEKLPLLILKNK